MADETKCEVCGEPTFEVITYWRESPPGRIRRPTCQPHGKIIWEAMAATLKDSAIIEAPPSDNI